MSEAAAPSKLERYGMIGLLVIQFGYHQTEIVSLKDTAREHAAMIAGVTAATNERRDGLERSVARLESAGNKQADAIADLRDIVVDLRAAMRRR